MSIFASLLMAALIAPAHAQVVRNECSHELLNLRDWSELHPNILNCLNQKPAFTDGLEVLCVNRQELSLAYKQYQQYRTDFEKIESTRLFLGLAYIDCHRP